jgi:hypothetical protein
MDPYDSNAYCDDWHRVRTAAGCMPRIGVDGMIAACDAGWRPFPLLCSRAAGSPAQW